MLDVGVFGSPFRSSGSSFVELLFESINGDERLLLFRLEFCLDERGDAAGTLCGV